MITRLSSFQIMCLGVFLMATYCVQLEPRFLIEEAGQTAWLAMCLSGLIGIIYALAYFRILTFCPSGFGEALHLAFGFWSSRLIGLFYLFLLLLYLALNLSLLNLFTSSTTLVMFPPWLISFFIIISAAYAARKGIQSIARISELLFLLSCLSAAFLLFMATRQADWGHVLPWFSQNAASLFASGLRFSRISAEMFFLVFLAPWAATPGTTPKTMMASILISFFWLSLFTLFATVTLGVPLVEISSFPIVTMVRSIYFTEFLQRFDVLLLTVWLGSIFIRCALVLFLFSYFTADLLLFEFNGFLAFPSAILSWALGSFMFTNILDFQAFYLDYWGSLILFLNVAIPGIVCLVIFLKRRFKTCV